MNEVILDKELTRMSNVKTYQTLFCGATFSAIGMAISDNNNSLIVEQSSAVGNDFIECLNPGDHWQQAMRNKHGKEFQQDLINRNLLTAQGHIHLPGVYPLLCERIHRENLNVLFLTEIVKVEKLHTGYEVTLHNVSGFTKIHVETIIDTTAASLSRIDKKAVPKVKRMNAYIDSSQSAAPLPDLIEQNDFQVIQGRFQSEVIFKLDLAPENNWIEARRKLNAYWSNRPQSLIDWKLTSIAGAFEIVPEEPQKISEDWFCIPSCGSDNLAIAFDKQIDQLAIRGDSQ
jgi:hypothetical protein